MTRPPKIRVLALVVAPVAAMAITACGGGGGSSATNSASVPTAGTTTPRTPTHEKASHGKPSRNVHVRHSLPGQAIKHRSSGHASTHILTRHTSTRPRIYPSLKNSQPTPVPASKADTQAVTKLVESYNAAVAADNGTKGCELMSAKEQKQLMMSTGQKTCAEVLTSECKQPSQEKFVSPAVKVTSVTLSSKYPDIRSAPQGPTVVFSVSTAAGVAVQSNDTLEREHGVWRLNSSGGKSWTLSGVSESSRAKLSQLAAVCM